MKRYVLVISLLFLAVVYSFGLSIHKGPETISGTQNWNGYDIYYIDGDITIPSGATLNISPNTSGSLPVYVIFLGNFGFKTSASGVLNVNGTSSRNIFFTADRAEVGFPEGNGNFGESGETFQNIEYWGATGSSIINYAVVEYGTGSLRNSFYNGGGIAINGRGITIKNTIIRNCNPISPAGQGAGVYIATNGGSLTLENLKIYNNTTTNNAGGVFVGGSNQVNISGCEIYNNTGAQGDGIFLNISSLCTITNSLIYNHSTGEGIYSKSSSSNTKILNCSIVNNINGLFSESSTSPIVTNTIVWGNSSSQFSGPGTPVVTYSGIQGGYSGTGNINLSSTNGDATGPNFTSVGSDWSIKFISPLRDAGTSGGSPSPPLTDILSKGRIFNYDIGAYEVQYSRWIGASSTSWSTVGNWAASVDPSTGTGDVVIPSGLGTYPNVTTTQNFTIGADKFMIVEPGAQVTLDGLTNNGTLNLNSDATGIFSLLVNSYSRGNGAAENIQLYLTGGASTLWHYISSPVSSISTSLFSSVGVQSLIRYEENYITNDWNNGWVSYAGLHFNPTTNTWQSTGTPWATLDAGRGYNYNSSSSERTFAISGQINVDNATVNLNFASGGAGIPAYQGYNLIGNPFTSAIDWDAVKTSALNTGQPDWSSVEQAIYFRSNGNLYVYNGVTVPNDMDGRYLAPMQGCFIKSNINNFNFYIPSGAKVHSANPRFKGAPLIPLVRLQIDNSGKSDQTVVRFDDKATLVFDNEFDARKLYPTSDIPAISSSLSGTEYSINGIPFPASSITIPILFSAPVSGTYSITAKELTGLENYKVTLTDKEQNFSVNLSETNSYTFSSLYGKYSNRLILTISNVITSIPEFTTSKAEFNIYFSQGILNIKTIGDLWDGLKGDVKVFDLTGRQLLIQKNNEFRSGDLLKIPVTFRTGVYLVEMRSGVNRYVGKVVIR